MLRSLVPRTRNFTTLFVTKYNSNLQWKPAMMMIVPSEKFSTTISRYQLEKPAILDEQKHQYKQDGGGANKKVSIFGWFMLLIPISTFGLGYWQVQRKKWKEALIAHIEQQTKQPPVDLPEDLTELNNMEYRTIRVRGEFLHDIEMFLGPRSLNVPGSQNSQGGGLISRQDSGMGFQVVTPFKLENSEHVILINRGWVPKKNVDQETRQQGQIEGIVEIVGIVRKADHRPPFSPGMGDMTRREWKRKIDKSRQETAPVSDADSVVSPTDDLPENLAYSLIKEKEEIKKEKKSWRSCARREKFIAKFREKWGADHFLFRDIRTMSELTGAEPYFLDATAETTVNGGPIGGQTRVQMRNEHLSYIVTWFSLSGLTSYLWYRQILKRIPR